MLHVQDFDAQQPTRVKLRAGRRHRKRNLAFRLDVFARAAADQIEQRLPGLQSRKQIDTALGRKRRNHSAKKKYAESTRSPQFHPISIAVPKRPQEIRAAIHTGEQLSVSRRFQTTVEKISCCVIRGKPAPMHKKIMNLVGENKLLNRDILLAKTRNEIDSLREIDVAVVIAMDEKNGRLPGVYRGDRRRVMRELGEFRRDILSIPVVRRPIVHAMKINSRGKQ